MTFLERRHKMSIPDVTGYSGSLPRAYADSAVSDDSTASTAKKKKSSLDMSDFLKLMAAQYQCQSIDSSVDNTEYITQMAMFSAVEAMNQLTANSDKQYASALIGLTATVAENDKTVTGIVQSAEYDTDGTSKIVINGNAYDVSDVTNVEYKTGGETSEDRQYALSLIGKTVTVKTADGTTASGTVQNVTYDSDGNSLLSVGGKTYDVSSVTEVQQDT